MKKLLLIIGILATMSQIACANDDNKTSSSVQKKSIWNSSMVKVKEESSVPQLHIIQEVTFPTTYSCNGSYETSALFLSDYSKRWNSPELLVNGACGSEIRIHVVTAGTDYGLVSDLGMVSIEDATSEKAFNWERSRNGYNVFVESMPIEEGHTYSVLVAKSAIRAQYFVQVVKIEGRSVTLRYVVKNYELVETVNRSEGFSWNAKNFEHGMGWLDESPRSSGQAQ